MTDGFKLIPRTEFMGLFVPESHVVVPVEPTDALLLSMAVRYDHGLGVPGYYDQELFSASGVTHAQRLESALSTMRQLHEEVVGKGFYRPKDSNKG
ncbi:hypothetical protein G6L37_06215 [Agrobacterium rubi]|nr:hypothetical protein [Agrobacterium rubi]NTF24956.1 hypothetical protein [Agrobacterium rubi]